MPDYSHGYCICVLAVLTGYCCFYNRYMTIYMTVFSLPGPLVVWAAGLFDLTPVRIIRPVRVYDRSGYFYRRFLVFLVAGSDPGELGGAVVKGVFSGVFMGFFGFFRKKYLPLQSAPAAALSSSYPIFIES